MRENGNRAAFYATTGREVEIVDTSGVFGV